MENISPALLAWFYQNKRLLPFRTDPSPYHVWLSEIMLQQTRVAAALPYYERFLRELPTIADLAACEEEKLHKLWEGLGYYSRVRNLQKAARVVCEQYGGSLPADYDALRALPGIGDYTAGAIASISFGLPVPAVDGNVLRVFARLYNDPACVTDPAVKRMFTARVTEHQPADRPGDYNEALMELGALVCVPNGPPLCGRCPLAGLCRANLAGNQLSLPVKTKPKPRRVQAVAVALVESPQGWLLQRRPETGLLAGLWQPALWEGRTFETAQEMQAALAALEIATAAPYGLRAGEAAGPAAEKAPVAAAAGIADVCSGSGGVFQPAGPDADAPEKTETSFDPACGAAPPLCGALPPAKHIFSHVEWRMGGWRFFAPAQPAPEGFVWAGREELKTVYTLPGAFRVYKKLMLEDPAE